MLAYLIHDKNVAESYRDYFELLWNQEQQTLKGFDGIKELCNRVLREEKDLYLIGANGALYQKYKAFFYEFDAKRIEKRIKRYHLALEKTRNHEMNKQKWTEARYLPKEFNSPMVIWIFGDNVANILWDEEIVYLTKNQKIADDYRKYFHMLWKSASV